MQPGPCEKPALPASGGQSARRDRADSGDPVHGGRPAGGSPAVRERGREARGGGPGLRVLAAHVAEAVESANGHIILDSFDEQTYPRTGTPRRTLYPSFTFHTAYAMTSSCGEV